MILSKLNLLLFIFGLNLMCYGYEPEPQVGLCPEKETINNFDMDRFLGLWYINSRYPFLDEIIPNCIIQNYKRINNTYRLEEGATVLPTNTNTTKKRYMLDISLRNISKDGHYVMYLQDQTGIAKVSVLDTDYLNYAVLYTCINLENVYHYISGVIATRIPKPSTEIMVLANDTLTMHGIGLEKMAPISFDIC